MPISDGDYKLLWGRAAGICSNPECQEDLTVILDSGSGFNVGEMAHVIARNVGGPRSKGSAGSDGYRNLILLCPTCHRKVDKAPAGTYTEEMLHVWKADHEGRVRNTGKNIRFASLAELKVCVGRLLFENHALWKSLGPASEVAQSQPGSNLSEIWEMRKIDRIIPNNSRIINLIENNKDLLNDSNYESYVRFKIHAAAFEDHQYERKDSYPLFPKDFSEKFGK